MIVDALVGFGYPFDTLMTMTFSDLRDWLDVALERVNKNDGA